MCSIIGALLHNVQAVDLAEVNYILRHVMASSKARGRDGYGYKLDIDGHIEEFRSIQREDYIDEMTYFQQGFTDAAFVANFRAEPTTEFIKEKELHDQQPYTLGEWGVVHNGTIANDKELRTNKLPTAIDSAAIVEQLDITNPPAAIRSLKGSYAILAFASGIHPVEKRNKRIMHVACNYRPIWYIQTDHGVFFASSEGYFPPEYAPQMVEPYTYCMFAPEGLHHTLELREEGNRNALVVCSGGLDSTVAATIMKRSGHNIHLLHFQYGCRPQDDEEHAVEQVAEALDCEVTYFPMDIYSPDDSPLLDPDARVAGGEEGAEFAHEWVPARNLVMLALATAYAEANGFDLLVLGNNLEEAGAYPDNEPEFIHKFNKLLPYAVADRKRVEVIMPVGNMMKHEIVACGLELKAPLRVTWSCYRSGTLHCGTCGPCFMRRTAFEINGEDEVIQYEH